MTVCGRAGGLDSVNWPRTDANQLEYSTIYVYSFRILLIAIVINLMVAIRKPMMAKRTEEYHAIIKATTKLTHVVKNELTPLSQELVARELISE